MANQLGQGGVFVAVDGVLGFGIEGAAATVTVELSSAGDPDTNINRTRGSLILETSAGILYINTSAVAGTTWVTVGSQV